LTAPVAPLPSAAINDLYGRIDPQLTNETEANLRKQANEVPAGIERETFLVRSLTLSVVYIQFETTWYNIFASQIEALQHLNTTRLKREDLFPYYTAAATADPHIYATYSFDQWLGYLRTQVLIREDGDVISITIRGREFLKYLIDNGRSSAGRSL
jgi:hypothetical protein